MDPGQPIQVTVFVDSPHVVQYALFVRAPGETKFPKFAEGTDANAGQPHTVGPLQAGSEIGGAFDVTGNPRTAYRIRMVCSQGGAPLQGGLLTVAGTTDDTGVDVQKGKVTL